MKCYWDDYYSKDKKIIRFINKHYFQKVYYNKLKKIIGNKKKLQILEAGCGEGLISAKLAENNTVTLLDYSEKALEESKKNFEKNKLKAKFVHGNIFNLPFKDETFDIIFNQGVIEHFDQSELAIKECYRVTKKGGYCLFFVPVWTNPFNTYQHLLKLINKQEWFPFEKQTFYTKKKLLKQLRTTNGYCEVQNIYYSIGFGIVGTIKK